MELGSSISIEKIRSGGSREEKIDMIPREVMLHLFLNRQKLAMISCSPEDLTELAAGYIVSHGYVDDHSNINIIEMCPEGPGSSDEGTGIENISAKVRAKAVIPEKIRPAYIPSGCGNIDAEDAVQLPTPIRSKMRIGSEAVLGLNRKNLSAQRHKKALGGLHSVSLFDASGGLLLVREDIGRHNCLDKIIGHVLINDIDITDKIIFTSGRISLDLVFKSARMSLPVVITNSSVTYSAVIMARRLGLTVIGYARGSRFNIYSCPERII